MEKENKFFLLFIIMIVCALLGTFFIVKMRSDSIKPVTATRGSESDARLTAKPIEVPTLTDSAITKGDQSKRYNIEVHYPVVLLAQHPELAKDANAVIRAFASDTIEKFTADVEDMYSPNVPKEFTSDLSVRWSAQLLSPSIISIRFDESEYIAGSAHPNTQTRVLNYDMERHLLLQTGDLFASSTKALPFLSNYTREKLKLILSDQPEDIFNSQALPGTEPTVENFSTISITKDGLLVIFPPYQVAPYARGTIQIPILLSELGDEISPRIRESIGLSVTNIVEATPDAGPNSGNKMEQ